MLSGHFFGANLPITGALPAGSEQHRAAAEPASQVLFQPTLPLESFLRGWVSSDSFALIFFLLSFLPAAVSGSLCPPRSTPVHTHLFSLPAGAAPLIISALLPQLELNHLLHITCRNGSYYTHGAGLSPSGTAGSELTTQRTWALAVLVQPTAPTP